MKNIVILISGRGSNMSAIVEACARESWPARVVAVISNRADAAGIDFARDHGIEAAVVEHTSFATRQAFDQALGDVVDAHAPDLIVLAGFMRILGPAFVARFEGRMMNVHPSLLPAFTGLHTHRRAMEAGCKLAGVTVHLVDAQLDHGAIVLQAAVPVRPDDTESTLAARVLKVEHVIYPRAVRWWVEGLLTHRGGIVSHRHGEPQWIFQDLPHAP